MAIKSFGDTSNTVNIQSGTVSTGSVNNNYVGTKVVTFDKPFNSTPVVVVTPNRSFNTSTTSPVIQLSVANVDFSSFTIYFVNGSSTSIDLSVNWVAVES